MHNGAHEGRRRNAAGDVKDHSNSISSRSPATREEIATVAEFAKNNRGEVIRISFARLNGAVIADLRTYFPDRDGKMQPSKKGVGLLVHKLPELANALQKAVTEARRLSLLKLGGER